MGTVFVPYCFLALLGWTQPPEVSTVVAENKHKPDKNAPWVISCFTLMPATVVLQPATPRWKALKDRTSTLDVYATEALFPTLPNYFHYNAPMCGRIYRARHPQKNCCPLLLQTSPTRVYVDFA